MTDQCCFFEAFHEAPDVAEVTDCLRKLLNHRHGRALAERPAAERTWLLCGGRPDAALRAFRATPTDGWPTGFYDMGESLPLSWVVLSELEETEESLPLRLMGAGKTLRRSVAALREAPVGEVRGALLLRMVERHIERRVRGVRTPEEAEEDEVMKGFPLVEAMQREARTEGRAEGTLLALVRIVERRLRRELSAVERDVLHERLAQLGDRAVDDALDLDAPALDAWLTRAAD